MRKNSIFTHFSIWFIKIVWQNKIGKKYNKKRNILCRFHPTCSNYTICALNKYGFWKGWIKGINRIKRCNKDNTKSTVDYP